MEVNKIYQGDSLELLKKLEDNSIDLVITSPPYSTLKTYIDFKGIPADDYVEWFIPYCKEIERVIKPTGSFILNINDKVEDRFRHPYVFDLVSEIYKQTGLKMFERLFWNKMKSLPNKSRFGDRVEFLFWFAKSKDFYLNIDELRVPYNEKSIKRMKKPLKKRFARTEGDELNNEYKDWAPNPKGALPSTLITISSESKRIADNHVAVYPIELVSYFIKGATKPNDIVLDPFIGSGTTAVACKLLNRRYLGFEIQSDYVEIAERRLADV
jgi:site-specific DNA-methyltransferase (adenine-specific)/site-specific DNA-methyltransferase (cytosine-N4-specific)